MYSRHGRIPATIGQVCEGLNAMIKVVEPDDKAKKDQAADAKATYEALEEVRSNVGKVRTEAEEQFATLSEKDVELETRVVELEKTGPHVEVVSPGEGAKEGQAADAKATHEALESLDAGKADKSVVDAVNKSVASVTAETQRLAKDSRTKDDLAVYSFEGGTTEYYLEDKFLPVTGASYYNFSKITFGAPPNGATNVIAAYEANKINFAKFDKSTLKWTAGDTDVRFGGTNPAQVTLSSRIVGGEFAKTGANLLTSDKVVAPDAKAQSGQAADAKATYEELKRLEEDSGGLTEFLTPTTHAELLTLRNSSQLVPGMQYRITDYVATTTQSNTQSANHPFDVIVTADDVNKLNEVARAIRHEGDTYFPEHTKFEAWKIWYSLDNDTNRFEWSDEENGKGVIYRMVDEFDNDVPYDCKGIKMQAFLGGDYSEDFVYTFGGDSDNSFYGSCSNHIGACINGGIRRINIITFGSSCSYNTFGSGCYDNIFGDDCYYNIFGDDCYDNTFDSGCNYNTFSDSCSDNYFGSGCYRNTFGSYCPRNTFGSDCYDNAFGPGCYNNTFGPGCYDNIFGSYCYGNNFGSTCYGNSLFNFYSAITLQNEVFGITIDCTKDRGEFEYCKNIEIKSGVQDKEISIDDVDQSYHTEIRPVNSITITI